MDDVLSKVDTGLAVELTREFIRTPTVNPPGDEAPLAVMIAERGADLGFQAELHPVAEGRANVTLTLPGYGGAGRLLYCGHLDTVQLGSAQWSHDPFGGQLADGRILGRGASDMKGGLAAMLAGMAALRTAGVTLPGDLVLAAVVGEEVDCLGSLSYLDAGGMRNVSALIVAEPTNLDVVIAHKGAVRLRVTVQGRASHSAMPHLGLNAISCMASFIQRLQGVRLAAHAHPLLSAPTVSVNTIQGGVRPNIVADQCTAGIDVRTLPGQRAGTVVAALRAVADEVQAEVPGAVIEIVADQDVAAVETAADDRLVRAALAAAGRATGQPTATRGLPLFSDASVLQPPTGVPAILFGPGDERVAHQADEYVDAAKVASAAGFFAMLPLQYAAEADT